MFQLLSTLRDSSGIRVGEQSAELMWWRDAEFKRVAAVQNAAPDAAQDAALKTPLIGPLRDVFTLGRMQRYGELAAARDPIHVDPEFAKSTPSGANIAQGKLIVAPVARLMHQHLGQDWLERGGFKLRLRRPVKAGEPIEAWARPLGKERFEVWCQKLGGERVIEGEAGLVSL